MAWQWPWAPQRDTGGLAAFPRHLQEDIEPQSSQAVEPRLSTLASQASALQVPCAAPAEEGRSPARLRRVACPDPGS